jgi:hypothetical protein
VTISRTQAILLGAAALLVLIVGIAVGSRCTTPVVEHNLIVTGIDAGPGERLIEQRLDGAVQAQVALIGQIEEKFEEDMAAFDEDQRVRYERLREGSLEDAARYLSEWNRRRRSASGIGSEREP